MGQGMIRDLTSVQIQLRKIFECFKMFLFLVLNNTINIVKEIIEYSISQVIFFINCCNSAA